MLCEDESRSPSLVSLPLRKSSAVRYIPLVVAFLSAAPSGIATTTAKISVVIRNVYRIGVLLSLRRANSIHPGQHAAFRSCYSGSVRTFFPLAPSAASQLCPPRWGKCKRARILTRLRATATTSLSAFEPKPHHD